MRLLQRRRAYLKSLQRSKKEKNNLADRLHVVVLLAHAGVVPFPRVVTPSANAAQMVSLQDTIAKETRPGKKHIPAGGGESRCACKRLVRASTRAMDIERKPVPHLMNAPKNLDLE